MAPCGTHPPLIRTGFNRYPISCHSPDHLGEPTGPIFAAVARPCARLRPSSGSQWCYWSLTKQQPRVPGFR